MTGISLESLVFWGISIFIISSIVYRHILIPRGIKIKNPFNKKKQWGKRYGSGDNLT